MSTLAICNEARTEPRKGIHAILSNIKGCGVKAGGEPAFEGQGKMFRVSWASIPKGKGGVMF